MLSGGRSCSHCDCCGSDSQCRTPPMPGKQRATRPGATDIKCPRGRDDAPRHEEHQGCHEADLTAIEPARRVQAKSGSLPEQDTDKGENSRDRPCHHTDQTDDPPHPAITNALLVTEISLDATPRRAREVSLTVSCTVTLTCPLTKLTVPRTLSALSISVPRTRAPM